MIKKIAWFFVLMLLTGAGVIIYLSTQKPHSDETVTVTRGSIERVVRGNGRIEGIGEPTPLSFPRPGKVNWMEEKAIDGYEVLMNDTLATQHPEALDIEIATADTELKKAESKKVLATLGRSKEAITQAKERLKQANQDVEAAQIKLGFLEKPAPPLVGLPHEIAEANRTIVRATANLELAKAALAQLEAGPTDKDKAVETAKVDEAKQISEDAENQYKAIKDAWSNALAKLKAESEKDQALKRLQLAQARRDQILQGPSEHEIKVAKQRVNLADNELKGVEAAKELLMKPPEARPASDQAIAEAKSALLQAKSREGQAAAALKDIQRNPEKAELDAADAEVERAQKSKKLLELYKEALSLRAPFTGRVVRRHVEPGANVNAFSPVITIVDFSSKMLRTEFDVSRLSEIKKDMQVTLTSKALKETLEGKVEKIVGVGTRKIFLDDPGASRGGEVVEVLIRVKEPAGEFQKKAYELLLPGLRMEASVTLERLDNVLRIPKGYVSNDGKEYVWVKAASANGNAEPQRRDVKCGLRDDQFIEIEGLPEGERVVKPMPAGQK
jgi:multidrug resistance efflux pump